MIDELTPFLTPQVLRLAEVAGQLLLAVVLFFTQRDSSAAKKKAENAQVIVQKIARREDQVVNLSGDQKVRITDSNMDRLAFRDILRRLVVLEKLDRARLETDLRRVENRLDNLIERERQRAGA